MSGESSIGQVIWNRLTAGATGEVLITTTPGVFPDWQAVPASVGPAGPQGPQGIPGEPGADGDTGPPGSQGADGAPGAPGADGADGAPGTPGAAGPPGPPGADGADGADGAMGPQGPAGADGAQGPQGVQGVTGAPGPPGVDGLDGADGQPGPIGPIGLTGATGPQGPFGKGMIAEDGPQGEMGWPGPVGLTGATGPQGPFGKGMMAEDGPQGEQGWPGPINMVGTNKIDNNAVTDAKLRDSLAFSVIGRDGATPGDPADITAGLDDLVLARSLGLLQFQTVKTAMIADAAVTLAHMANLAASTIIGRRSGSAGVPEAATLGAGLSMSAGAVLNVTGLGVLYPIICEIEDFGTGLTALVLNHGGVSTQDTTGGVQIAFTRGMKWVQAAVNAKHDNGSDPGDWTLVVEKNGASAASFVFTMTNIGWANNVTVGAPSAELQFSNGDVARVYIVGPSTDQLRCRATLDFLPN